MDIITLDIVRTFREYVLSLYEKILDKNNESIEVYPILMDKNNNSYPYIWNIDNKYSYVDIYKEIVIEMNKYSNRYSKLVSTYLNQNVKYNYVKISECGTDNYTILFFDKKNLPIIVSKMKRIELFLDTALQKKAISTAVLNFNKDIKTLVNELKEYCKNNDIYIDNDVILNIYNNPSICYKGLVNHRLSLFNY